MCGMLLAYFIAEVLGRLVVFLHLGRDMHQLFRDAADVHTRTAKAPFRTVRTRVHIVEESDREAELFGLEGTAEAATATSDHNQIVFLVDCEGQLWLHAFESAKPAAAETSSESTHTRHFQRESPATKVNHRLLS